MTDEAQGNDVVHQQNQVPANQASNPFEEIANQAPRRIVGQLLKFSKGDWLYGAENDELPVGTRLIANMDQMLTGWIKWWDNKPVDQRMGLVSEGFRPAKRNELEDLDQTRWQTDDKGQPRDPWQKTFYVVFRQLDGEGNPMKGEEGLFTFTTASVGGTDAVLELCKFYGKRMGMHPDEWPVITLGKPRVYEHPNKTYGRIKTPKFDFLNTSKGWIAKDQFGDIIETEMEDGEDIPF